MPLDTEFLPVMTSVYREDPRLEFLDRDELVSLLPRSMQAEVRRADWAIQHIDELAEEAVVDPLTGLPASNYTLTRDDILLLFDPEPKFVEGMSEEKQLMAYLAEDPVMWVRFYLKMNPRIYQILILRNPSTRKILRLGRRCGKSATFVFLMAWKSWTRPGNKSLLIAPMKPHCEVVYRMMKDALRRNELFASMLQSREIRSVESPNFQFTFPNGSMITMFTSGIKSKNNADNVRGQEADDVYLDEVDLMSADDLPAFTAILRNTGRGEKTMTIASTPNGRRDMLYKFCTEFRDPRKRKRPYKEYYFPTHADSNYTPEDDEEQRSLLTREQYKHEILALFGEETSGVFLKSHIERAINHFPDGYDYLSLDDMFKRGPNSKLVVGVDWDKYGAGVNIVMCVVSFDDKKSDRPDYGRIKPVARWEIPRGPETLINATEFVKDVHSAFHPDAIYIDRGYGDMQYEELMKSAREGKDFRTRGLDLVLRGVHFAENITVYEPKSNAKIDKPAKDYMVTSTIKAFENDRIILNCKDYDNVPGPTDMIKQFEGYQVVRHTMLGKPVYEAASSSIGDHALDGFMLCILAVEEKWGGFARPENSAKPRAFEFNLIDAMGEKVSMGKVDDDRPARFMPKRTNIKAGRMTYNGSRTRVKRKSF